MAPVKKLKCLMYKVALFDVLRFILNDDIHIQITLMLLLTVTKMNLIIKVEIMYSFVKILN